MIDLSITSLYAAILGLILIPITLRVGLYRVKTGISLLHEDNDELLKRIRSHGNFLEYVPFALFIIALVEINGAPNMLVHGLGATLLVARVMHYLTLNISQRAVTREISMLGTIGVFIAGCGWLLYSQFIGA